MDAIKTIPPLMRGLTFDGEKGAHIVFETEKKPGAAEFIMPENENDIGTSLRQACMSGGICRPVYIAGTGTFTPVFPESVPGSRKHIDGKVFIITGGAQGFGAGIVRSVAQQGGFVVIADLNAEAGNKLASEINDEFGRECTVCFAADVTSEGSVAELMQKSVGWKGGIDVFISNAGVLRAGSVKEMDAETFRFVTEVNYTAFFLCTKHVSKIMSLQNSVSGSYYTDIIQINSKSGLAGSNRNSAYAGGKFGGLGLTQSFALELAADLIKVNAVCPGNFFDGPLWADPVNGLFVQYLHAGKVKGAKTVDDVKRHYEAQVPFGRGCRVEDVVRAVFYIVEQKYETGQAVPVTGGQIMLK